MSEKSKEVFTGHGYSENSKSGIRLEARVNTGIWIDIFRINYKFNLFSAFIVLFLLLLVSPFHRLLLSVFTAL